MGRATGRAVARCFRRTPGAAAKAARDEAGFTLLEVMATVVCIGILAAIAVPRVGGYLLDTRLNGAKPYLMEVAARNRMTKVETGSNCCTTTPITEDVMIAQLPAALAEAGDFCFVLVTDPAKFAYKTNAVTGTDFEVWAVLRGPTASDTLPNPANGVSCAISTSNTTAKASPTGWVRPSSSGTAGRAGKSVVLHYPVPPNGPTTAADTAFTLGGGFTYTWREGFATDALVP